MSHHLTARARHPLQHTSEDVRNARIPDVQDSVRNVIPG
jgi:hypothetical protein